MSGETDRHWKTVWITGASSGIGHELAQQLINHASKVAVSARSADKLNQLAGDHPRISSYPLDVTDPQAVAGVVADIDRDCGPIDLAILNAAAWNLVDMTDFELKAIRQGFEVNYMGVVHCLKAILPSMLGRGSGHIAIVASTAGFRGLPRSGAYGPTKAALINLAETLHIELAPRGITVSLVCPGFVDTPATRRNPFPMPGIISAPDAARRIIAGLERKRYEISFPFMFVLGMKLMRILPIRLYFWLIRSFVWKEKAGQ
jgi:short-subunit dehydrogenase